MDTNMDIFSMLGVENPMLKEEQEMEEKARKEKAKKASAKTKKNAAAKEATFKLPADILIPYAAPISGFSIEGKTEATEKEILAELKARYPWCIHTALRQNKGFLNVVFKAYSAVSKGVLSGAKKLVAGSIELTLADDVSVDDAKELLTGVLPFSANCPVSFLVDGDTAVPVFSPDKKLSDTGTVKNVILPTLEYVSYDATTAEDVRSVLGDVYTAEMKAALSLFALGNDKGDEEDAAAIILQDNINAVSMAKKADAFKLHDDMKISLGFTQLNISPDDFGGKTEARKTDICKFIVNSGYPEYSEKRTSIESINDNLLVAILKSSTKGAEIRQIAYPQITDELKKVYSLFTYVQGGSRYRGEVTRLGNFFMCMDGGGSFALKLPKIPSYIISAISDAFLDVSETFGTEAAVQLFWDTALEKYFVYVPVQTAAPTTITFERCRELEFDDRYVLCADFHSHGALPAFFSSVDNQDEQGTRIFGVFGNYGNDDKVQILFRAGSGGYFCSLNLQDIVEDQRNLNARVDMHIQMMHDFRLRINFYD